MRKIFIPALVAAATAACVGALDQAVDVIDNNVALSEAFVNEQLDRYCDTTLPEERAVIMRRVSNMSTEYDFKFDCEHRSATRVVKVK
jgi:hypothetical protein